MVWKWLPWILTLAGIAAFALFPVAYSEGDSILFNRSIDYGAIWWEAEPLDFYTKVKLYDALRGFLVQPTDAFQIVAVLAGGVYIFSTTLFARAVGRTRRDIWISIGGLLAIANILFFFRYIENYAVVSAMSVLLMWGCWRYIEGNLPFTTVVAIAVTASLFHGEALWWAPMVIAAFVIHTLQVPSAVRWKTALFDMARGTVVGFAIIVLILGIFILDGYTATRFEGTLGHSGVGAFAGADHSLFVPLTLTSNPREYFTFFSWSHLGAIVQEQLLVAPMAIPTIFIICVFAWKDVLRVTETRPALIALSLGAFGTLALAISWNPDLGPRSDWDLLALSAIPLTALAIVLLTYLKPGKMKRLAISAYLSVSAVHMLAWLLLHVLGIVYSDR